MSLFRGSFTWFLSVPLLALAAALAGGGSRPEVAILLPADLARAAKSAPAEIAALYRTLAQPSDRVAEGGKPGESVPYEQFACDQVERFLKSSDPEVSALQRLQAAETALAVVLRYHLSQRERPLFGENPWIKIENRLRSQLLDVRRQHLHAAASEACDEAQWQAVLDLAERLVQTYPRDGAILAEAARARTGYAAVKLFAGDDAAARHQIEWVEERFLQPPRFQPVRVGVLLRPGAATIQAALQEKARTLLEASRSTRDDRALEMLRQARRAWPRLPGLHDEFLRLQNAYKVLYVGVKTLPEYLSPATACTAAEKQAVELLFEGLVKATYHDKLGQRFVPQLANGAPEILAGGRGFRLDRDARWSNGERVTANEVRDTALLLNNSSLSGRTPEWADLVEVPIVKDDPFRIDFKFRQEFLEPLAPLAFKVLPQKYGKQLLQRADDPEFAKAPVGSGPYLYRGREQEEGRTCAVFVANPYYRRLDRPQIREIRFYVSTDPVRDLLNKKQPLHLLPDVPTAQLRDLQAAGFKGVRTLENRRVYVLAVNHRVAALADRSVRRAFAHALDRDRVLTFYFRGGEPALQLLHEGAAGSAAAVATTVATAPPRKEVFSKYHRPANGPYPPQSWACCPPPDVPRDLFDLERARAFASEAKAKLPVVELTLKHPDDDPRVALACRDLAEQLMQLGASVGWKVKITPVAVSPRGLREALEKREYELAYHALDYADETYWLWPLFDSRPEALKPGGANYLQYENDSTLEGRFREAMGQKDFAKVRKLTHAIHAHLHERMPLIPLWQLDTHVAVHPDLRPTRLDPLLTFEDVAEWRLEKK